MISFDNPTTRRVAVAVLFVLVAVVVPYGALPAGAQTTCSTPGTVSQGTDYSLTTIRNVRTGPDFGCPVVTVLAKGSPLTVHPGLVTADGFIWAVVTAGDDRGWLAVRRADGTGGVLTAASTSTGCVTPTPTPTGGTNYRLTQIRNIRTGPDFDCSITSLLPKNSQIVVHPGLITADGFVWAVVTANGQRGWMSVRRADGTGGVLAAGSNIDCRVPAVRGGTRYRLTQTRNVRTGPDFDCALITELAKDSQIIVHSGLVTNDGFVWAVVTAGGQRGWMTIRRDDGTGGVLAGRNNPVSAGLFFSELERIPLAGRNPTSVGAACDAPPPVFPISSSSGSADPSTLFTVINPGNLNLVGNARYVSNVPSSGSAVTARFDVSYTNLSTGVTTSAPEPLGQWSRTAGGSETTEESISISNGFGVVGPGRVQVEVRSGLEDYPSGSVSALVAVAQEGPACIDLCGAVDGDLYVANPAIVDGEPAGGCFGFGPEFQGEADGSQPTTQANRVEEFFDRVEVAMVTTDPQPSLGQRKASFGVTRLVSQSGRTVVRAEAQV